MSVEHFDFGSGFDGSFGTEPAAGSLYIPYPMDCRSCNLCLSHCPTYKITERFEESPQGRLKLIAQILNEGVMPNAEESESLEHCVECRACEKVCPSKMPYQALLDSAREKLPEKPRPLSVRALRTITRRKARLRTFVTLLRALQSIGLQSLLQKTGVLQRFGVEHVARLLPDLKAQQSLQSLYPALGERQGRVALFTGCLTSTLDQQTLRASIHVLTHLGFEVQVPQRQQCCGAIHAHNGDACTAEALAAENQAAFEPLTVDAIVYTASACGSHLREYAVPGVEGSEGFKAPLMDVNTFIAQAQWPEKLQLKPLNQQIFVHEPCSQQFPGDSSKDAYAHLERIPGAEVSPLPDNNLCCGAGGTYMLTEPGMSMRLRQEKISPLKNQKNALLASSNIGCALHLATGIREQGLGVEVVHPLELLARQLTV